MYGSKYDVNYAIQLLFNEEFGLSCSETREGEGEDAYCHRGEACLNKESVVEDFGSKSVSSCSGFSLDESEGNKLGRLSRGRLGDIKQLVQFVSIIILQSRVLALPGVLAVTGRVS